MLAPQTVENYLKTIYLAQGGLDAGVRVLGTSWAERLVDHMQSK